MEIEKIESESAFLKYFREEMRLATLSLIREIMKADKDAERKFLYGDKSIKPKPLGIIRATQR